MLTLFSTLSIASLPEDPTPAPAPAPAISWSLILMQMMRDDFVPSRLQLTKIPWVANLQHGDFKFSQMQFPAMATARIQRFASLGPQAKLADFIYATITNLTLPECEELITQSMITVRNLVTQSPPILKEFWQTLYGANFDTTILPVLNTLSNNPYISNVMRMMNFDITITLRFIEKLSNFIGDKCTLNELFQSLNVEYKNIPKIFEVYDRIFTKDLGTHTDLLDIIKIYLASYMEIYNVIISAVKELFVQLVEVLGVKDASLTFDQRKESFISFLNRVINQEDPYHTTAAQLWGFGEEVAKTVLGHITDNKFEICDIIFETFAKKHWPGLTKEDYDSLVEAIVDIASGKGIFSLYESTLLGGIDLADVIRALFNADGKFKAIFDIYFPQKGDILVAAIKDMKAQPFKACFAKWTKEGDWAAERLSIKNFFMNEDPEMMKTVLKMLQDYNHILNDNLKDEASKEYFEAISVFLTTLIDYNAEFIKMYGIGEWEFITKTYEPLMDNLQQLLKQDTVTVIDLMKACLPSLKTYIQWFSDSYAKLAKSTATNFFTLYSDIDYGKLDFQATLNKLFDPTIAADGTFQELITAIYTTKTAVADTLEFDIYKLFELDLTLEKFYAFEADYDTKSVIEFAKTWELDEFVTYVLSFFTFSADMLDNDNGPFRIPVFLKSYEASGFSAKFQESLKALGEIFKDNVISSGTYDAYYALAQDASKLLPVPEPPEPIPEPPITPDIWKMIIEIFTKIIDGTFKPSEYKVVLPGWVHWMSNENSVFSETGLSIARIAELQRRFQLTPTSLYHEYVMAVSPYITEEDAKNITKTFFKETLPKWLTDFPEAMRAFYTRYACKDFDKLKEWVATCSDDPIFNEWNDLFSFDFEIIYSFSALLENFVTDKATLSSFANSLKLTWEPIAKAAKVAASAFQKDLVTLEDVEQVIMDVYDGIDSIFSCVEYLSENFFKLIFKNLDNFLKTATYEVKVTAFLDSLTAGLQHPELESLAFLSIGIDKDEAKVLLEANKDFKTNKVFKVKDLLLYYLNKGKQEGEKYPIEFLDKILDLIAGIMDPNTPKSLFTFLDLLSTVFQMLKTEFKIIGDISSTLANLLEIFGIQEAQIKQFIDDFTQMPLAEALGKYTASVEPYDLDLKRKQLNAILTTKFVDQYITDFIKYLSDNVRKDLKADPTSAKLVEFFGSLLQKGLEKNQEITTFLGVNDWPYLAEHVWPMITRLIEATKQKTFVIVDVAASTVEPTMAQCVKWIAENIDSLAKVGGVPLIDYLSNMNTGVLDLKQTLTKLGDTTTCPSEKKTLKDFIDMIYTAKNSNDFNPADLFNLQELVTAFLAVQPSKTLVDISKSFKIEDFYEIIRLTYQFSGDLYDDDKGPFKVPVLMQKFEKDFVTAFMAAGQQSSGSVKSDTINDAIAQLVANQVDSAAKHINVDPPIPPAPPVTSSEVVPSSSEAHSTTEAHPTSEEKSTSEETGTHSTSGSEPGPSDPAGKDTGKPLSSAAIAGITIGAVIVVVALVVGIILYQRRRRNELVVSSFQSFV